MAATAVALLPFDVWPDGIVQPSTFVNDNALRAQVVAQPALSFEATQPGAPADPGLYILSAAWGDEAENTLALYQDGAWSYWLAFDGMPKKVGDIFYEFAADTGDGSWNPAYSSLGDYADDTAAASGGIAVSELYRTGSTLKVRIA